MHKNVIKIKLGSDVLSRTSIPRPSTLALPNSHSPTFILINLSSWSFLLYENYLSFSLLIFLYIL